MRVWIAAVALMFATTATLPVAYAQTPKKGTAKQDAKSQDKDDDTGQETSLDNFKDGPPAPQLNCAGPFAKDTSHAKLVSEFGDKNVAFKDVETPGNIIVKATVIFDNDPTKRAA